MRHVLSENERVDATVAALERGDLDEVGALLDASHRSLRDDYEVSVPEVERAVETCRQAGALGARIMGGGFGGSVLALFPPRRSCRRAVSVEPGPAARSALSRPRARSAHAASGERGSDRTACPWTAGWPTRTCAPG